MAPKKQPSFIETEEHKEIPQNKIILSISPFLAPEEPLLRLDQPEKKGKRGEIKRLPPPIMYSIEPMPEKIATEVVKSEAKEQALLGDQYDLQIKFSKQDNIKLKSLKAKFVSFTQ